MTKPNYRNFNGEPCFEAVRRLEVGLAALDRRDLDKAIAEFTKIIRRCPNYVDAYGFRAVAYREKGDFDKAIADFTTAIGLAPNDNLYACRGAAYGKKGEHAKAIADCTEAIHRNARNFFAFINRGCAYMYTNDRDKAIADFNDARRINPRLTEACLSQAVARAQWWLPQSRR